MSLTRSYLVALLLSLSLALSGCVPLIIGGALSGAVLVSDRRGAQTVARDVALSAGVARQLEPLLDARYGESVFVTSYNRRVVLYGRMPDRALADRAVAIAQAHASDIREVIDELRIGPPIATEMRNGDLYLTSAVKGRLFNIYDLPGFEPSKVKVFTSEGTVYLMGLLTPTEIEAVVAQARRVNGVQQLILMFEAATT